MNSTLNTRSLPLTKENLKHLDRNSHDDNEILSRYCRNIEYMNYNNNVILAQQYNCDIKRSQSVPLTVSKSDIVVASPRILPFPYHNDSLFLPTAEQIQYNFHSSSQDSSFRTESSSTLPRDLSSLMSRPHSTTNITHGGSSYSVSMISALQHQKERISLSARFEHQLKFKRFRRTSSITSSSIAPSIEYLEPQQQKKSWIKRFVQVFNKKKNNNAHFQKTVWYCQYSENPTPCFQKYS